MVDSEDCWIWAGALHKAGYGVICRQLAHRVMYENLVGPIPIGLVVDHLCRVRQCVNPGHMEPVTISVNVTRGEPGKYLKDRTHCPAGHPYIGNNLITKNNGGRICRECSRRRSREYMRRKRKGVNNG